MRGCSHRCVSVHMRRGVPLASSLRSFPRGRGYPGLCYQVPSWRGTPSPVTGSVQCPVLGPAGGPTGYPFPLDRTRTGVPPPLFPAHATDRIRWSCRIFLSCGKFSLVLTLPLGDVTNLFFFLYWVAYDHMNTFL